MAMLLRNRLCHGSMMMRRSVLNRAGHYDTSYPCSQDYDLALRFCEVTQVACLPDYLYQLRLHRASLSSTRRAEQVRFARRARQAAWRRRVRSLRLWDQKTLMAWVCAAVQQRKLFSASVLLAKAFAAEPRSIAPFHYILDRIAGRLR